MNKKTFLSRTKAISLDQSQKSIVDTGSGEVSGYASIFGNIDQHNDVVERGAFTKTLQERGDKVLFLWQHNKHEVIGKIVELREDEKGLFFRAQFAPTPRGQEARELIKMGALGGFSFGFNVVNETRERLTSGRLVNRLKELRISEISAVSQPCNEEAVAVGVKSVEDEFSEDEMALIEEFKSNLIAQRTADMDESPSEAPEGVEGVNEALHAAADEAAESAKAVEELGQLLVEEAPAEEAQQPEAALDLNAVKEAIEFAFIKEQLRRSLKK